MLETCLKNYVLQVMALKKNNKKILPNSSEASTKTCTFAPYTVIVRCPMWIKQV